MYQGLLSDSYVCVRILFGGYKQIVKVVVRKDYGADVRPFQNQRVRCNVDFDIHPSFDYNNTFLFNLHYTPINVITRLPPCLSNSTAQPERHPS